MSFKTLAPFLMVGGIGLSVVGYAYPALVGHGSRPYAYISVMAFGAMVMIAGALLWRDR